MEHLAVMRQPHLDRLLTREKRVECRLSRRKTAPFGLVRAGDLLWFKEVSGPVVARAFVRRVWCIELANRAHKREVVERFGEGVGSRAWLARAIRSARYASFAEVGRVERIDWLWLDKRDRRGWVALAGGLEDAFRVTIAACRA